MPPSFPLPPHPLAAPAPLGPVPAFPQTPAQQPAPVHVPPTVQPPEESDGVSAARRMFEDEAAQMAAEMETLRSDEQELLNGGVFQSPADAPLPG